MAINPLQPPIQYGMEPQDPAAAMLEGLKIGEVFRQRRQMREQEQLAEQYKADASAYYANPTPQGALELARKYPEQGAALMQDYRALGAEQRKGEATRVARVAAALGAGRQDIAKKLVSDEILAVNEAGGDATNFELINAAIEKDPNAAYGPILQILTMMDSKLAEDLASTLEKTGALGGQEDQYRFLTPEEIAANPNLDPKRAYQKDLETGKVSAVGGGGDKIIVGGEQETEFSKQTGKDLAKQFTALSTLGQQAARSSVKINQLEQAFRSADVKTGAEGVISTALSRFGIDIPGATQYQQIDALVASLIPLQRPEGSGTTSDKDMENFKRALPSLMGTKEGQLQIIQDMKALSDHDMKVGEIANQVRSGQISPFEGQRLISELSNPLEKYSTAEGASAGGEGFFVTAPDGSTYKFSTQEQANAFKAQLGL